MIIKIMLIFVVGKLSNNIHELIHVLAHFMQRFSEIKFFTVYFEFSMRNN